MVIVLEVWNDSEQLLVVHLFVKTGCLKAVVTRIFHVLSIVFLQHLVYFLVYLLAALLNFPFVRLLFLNILDESNCQC